MKASRTLIAAAIAAVLPLGAAIAADNDQYGSKGDAGTLAIRSEALRHTPHGLRDDCDGNDLQPVQQARSDWTVEGRRRHGKNDQQEGRWQCERGPGGECAHRASAQESQSKADLT